METNAKTMGASNCQTELSELDQLTIELVGKIQDPISWFCCSFDAIHSFGLGRDQLTLLLSPKKQSFVDEILDQLKSTVLGSMCDTLIKHCKNKQIEWNQAVDLQSLVDAMSFTHLNNLQQ